MLIIDLALNMYEDVKDALAKLKGTYALTLIKQVPLVGGLAVMIGVAAH